MDGATDATDRAYEEDRARAERVFFIDRVQWHQMLVTEMKQQPALPKADAKKIVTEAWVTGLRGDPPKKPAQKPHISFDLGWKLRTMCIEFGEAELSAA